MNKKNQKFLILFLLAFAMILAPATIRAMTVKSRSNVILDQDIKGNFFGGGNLIVINSTVNGDVFVGGNSINIRGTINGDVFAAGSNINISGTINGNLRAAGSDITISGRVERNVLAGATNLILENTGSVGGNITYAGASLLLSGPVASEVVAVCPNVVINSSIGGDVTLRIDMQKSRQGQGQLSVLDKAVISGNLNYKAVSEAEIRPSAKILGQTNYTPVKPLGISKGKLEFKKFFWVTKGIDFLSLFLAGLLLIYLLPKVTDRIYSIMKRKPWSDLGIGLVALIVTPIVGFLLLFTVISIPLVFMAWSLFVVAIYFAKALVAIAVGRWIIERFNWHWHKILSLLLGLVILFVVSLIPFVGWLACFLAVLWAFGGLLRVKLQILKELR